MDLFSTANLMLASADPVAHVAQHTLVTIGPKDSLLSFPIVSNVILMQVIGALLLLWLIPRAVRMRAGDDAVGKHVPRGFGTAIEQICLVLRENIFRPNLGHYTDMFTPFLWSLFFFVLVMNVLGLIPFGDWASAINPTLGELIGGTATANFYVTGALAFVVLCLIVGNGLRFHGMAYVKHFFMGPWWIAPLIAVIEIAGVLFKAGALCIRLTANMLAGHILLAVLLGFVGGAFASLGPAGGYGITAAVIIGSVLIYFLEVLVAFLHAFIFTTLTAVFIGLAVNIHHDEEHDHEHETEHAEGAVAGSH